MAAYGALVSLLQTLDTILHSNGLPVSLNRDQLESLHEKVSFLQQFLENPLRKTSNQKAAENLEIKIRDASFKAEDLIEAHILNLPEPRIEQNENPPRLRSSLFSAVKNAVIFVSVGNLCHFAVKKFLPIGSQNLKSPVVLFLTAVGTSPFFAKYVIQDLTKVKKDNPDPENQGLSWVIKEVGSIVNEVNNIDAASSPVNNINAEYSAVNNINAAYSAEVLQHIRTPLRFGSPARGDSETTGKNVVVGLDSYLEEMIARLTQGSKNLEVVPIVGMGGIGKTTLARQVYDDNYIGRHFEVCAWVTVSQEYSLSQVLIGLLDSSKMLTENMYGKGKQELARDLYQSLKDRRYLLVIDDMWDTDIWDAVRMSFPEDSNGSRVLLTTRLSEVARYAKLRSPLHRMRFLSQGDSWDLLCSKVFGENDCPRELKQIGKEIAGNCEGLPLAIVVIGGLLSKVSRTEEYWRSVADNLNSVVTKDDDRCMKILSLSYNHLPHHLRPCFLYMGAFPEDYEIPASKLIRLWAAEGFLKPHRFKSVEELAEEYLIDLIERNLVLACKKSANGKIKTCSIHDLLRNLCIRNAHKEKFLYVVKGKNDIPRLGINSPRRLSIHPNFLSIQPGILYESKIRNWGTHSLLCTGVRLIYPSQVYLDRKLLRVLDLVIVRFFDFPNEIVNIVNLRYLAFTYNDILPPSISQLQNLETLVHHNWTYRHCPFLPVEIWTMPKLRHLCVTPSFFRVPHNAQILTNPSLLLENLQTLLEVRNFRFSKNILKRIPNLKTLEVSYDVSPSSVWSSYQLEAVVHLHQLETLKILIKNSDHTSEIVNPRKLAFPLSLKRLTLSGCFIPWRYMKIVGALPNLEVLKLRNNACRGSLWQPDEEGFRRLKYLLLEELDLAEWNADETHFPRLERLIIRSCYKLKEIPSGIGEKPTLEMIELVDCHSSVVTSAKEIEEEQQSLGNEDLKVHVDSRRRFKNKFYSRILH